MKRKYIIIPAIVLLAAVVTVLAFSTVPIPEEKECLVIKGLVTEIREGGVKDAVFKLHNDKRFFYINRGLENGLDLEALRKELMGQEVTIKYPDYFSLLDFNGEIEPISKMEHNGKVIFSELIN